MPLTRERLRTPAFLPLPAPLPSLRDALARRAAIFGPVDLDPALMALLGPWQDLSARLRRAADLLNPVGR